MDQHESQMLKTNIFKQYFKLVALCWYYAEGQRAKMVLFYFLFFIANCMLMAEPYVIGQVINTLQAGGDNLLSEIAVWLGIYAVLSLMFWVFHGPARIIERLMAFDIKRAFNLRHYDMLARLPLHWHHDHHTGNTTNRLNKASLSLQEFASTQFIYMENIVRFVLVFIMIGWINIYLSAGLLITTCATFYILTLFDKILIRKTHEVNEKEHIYSSVFFDYVSNMANVIMFNLRHVSKGILASKIDDYYAPHKTEIQVNEYKWFIRTIIIAISQFVVLFGYILYHQEQNIPLMLGTLVMLFQYMIRLDYIFVAFAAHYERIVRYFTNIAAIEPIAEDYKAIGVKDDEQKALKVSNGAIAFEDIAFTYQQGVDVFKEFNLDIKPGERVGLVGPSGAGKTTLIHLLLRFYDVSNGAVKIDGQNIGAVSSQSLREAVSVIPQDTSLFEDTLMENIRYGRLDASDEEVIAAAQKAHADEFIEKLEKGYSSFVGERGVKLSGGQRQRIAIARAILRDAPILILDEATSALDSESEHLIQQSLQELMKGKTVIAIAHRLSTIARLDRLVVMDDGNIVEDGAHDDLLQNDGLYAKLWAMQSGGFLGDETH